MVALVGDAVDRLRQSAELLLGGAASVRPEWLAAGLLLHLAAQLVRVRGWWNILRAAYPGERDLRVRDVAASYMAGSGLNGILPARGGDVVKLAFLRRRIERSSYATLAATSVPETA